MFIGEIEVLTSFSEPRTTLKYLLALAEEVQPVIQNSAAALFAVTANL